MAGNKRGSGCAGVRVGQPGAALRQRVPGPALITRVRLSGRSWILWLRFGLYVNLGRKSVPEE